MLQNPKCYDLEGDNLLSDPETISIYICLWNNLYYLHLLVLAIEYLK